MLLAGCGNIFGGDPDVVVFNRTDSELTADVALVDDTDEELLSETATIEADGAFEQDDVLPEEGTLTLSVAVEGGPSDDREFEISDAPSLQARIDEDAIEFEKT